MGVMPALARYALPFFFAGLEDISYCHPLTRDAPSWENVRRNLMTGKIRLKTDNLWLLRSPVRKRSELGGNFWIKGCYKLIGTEYCEVEA